LRRGPWLRPARSDDVAQHFDDVARLLANLDVDKTWKAATEVERRVLIDEFIEEILVLPDYLDVTVHGAPPLHVRYQEVGMKESGLIVSEGPITQNPTGGSCPGRLPDGVPIPNRQGSFFQPPSCAAIDQSIAGGRMEPVTEQVSITLRRRITIALTGTVLVGGALLGILAMRSGQAPIAGQRDVIPQLVPDIGGLHAGSQGPTAAPKVASEPGIRLIPSAGAPVKAYGGAPGGTIFVPVERQN
jgi:hypothetical protein